MEGVISINIKHNQIIFPKSQIFIDTNIPIKKEFVQGAFHVEGLHGRVHLSKDGKHAKWMSTEPMPEGPHKLYVNELIFSNGTVSRKNLQVPFFFVDSKAQIPSDATVYHMSRIAVEPMSTKRIPLGKTRSGKYIEIMKAIRNKTDMPAEFAYDSRERPINANKVFKKINENRTRRFGKFHETLHTHLRRSKANSRVDVAIWIRLNEREASRNKSI